ncbi:MAG: ABC transporter ATP-binding protein [Clostridia bacterium]|nr:ABC transporter ATP-binding protein [Clostridia bacterium]
MKTEKILANAPIPQSILDKAEKFYHGDELPLFVVVGDLDLRARYGSSALFVFRDELIAFDEYHEDGTMSVKIADIEEAKVKRMYGNAVFRVTLKNGEKKTLIRFTYAATDISDAAALYINRVNEGDSVEETIEVVRASYQKMRSFCKKCGRKLPNPDAECINCQGKSKLLSKFAVYVKPHLPMLGVCLILSVICTVMSLVPPYITKTMVDDVIPNKNSKMLVYTILFLLGVYIFHYTVGTFRAYYLRITGDRIVTDLKKDVYRKAQYLPMSFYDKTSTGAVINRINGDTAVLQQFMLRITQEAVVQAFTLVGVTVIMFAMNWRLALLSLLPVPIVTLTGRFYGKKIAPKYRRLWRRGSSLYSILTDSIPGIRVIKAFTSEKRAINKYERYCEDWMKESKSAAVPASIMPHVISFFVICGSVIIWYVGGGWVIDSERFGVTLGMLVSFISYANMFYAPVNFFATLNDTYQNALASAEKILDILNAEPENDFGKGKTLKRIEGKIEFRNVNFSFDRSKKTLSDVNFVIEPGDIVGIVGTTGAGKSTLINLLMRYYDDYEGEILIDGVNIKDIDLEYYRNRIGYVQQEPLMFRDTIFNNIAYCNPDAHVEQIINAADVANAHGFISRLPDAYDTMLGERGVGLSGGEKQRLSIARAVLKNPSILIFDEATAAVDSETEHLIQESIERLIKGRTTLMIAHRLSTLRKANKIIVVDKGKILEFGTPEELLAMKGKYYKLIQIQSMSDQARKIKEEERLEVEI